MARKRTKTYPVMREIKQTRNKILIFANNSWSIIGITLLIYLCLEGISYMINYLGQEIESDNYIYDKRESSEAYTSQQWAGEYFREFQESANDVWNSYYYWRRAPYNGKHINVDQDGLRHTYNPPTYSATTLNIFVFGGSTIWGTGSRDNFTVPSYISKILESKGYKNFYVKNFGESGYVSTQELISFYLELRDGNIPDIVIFYDGVNDTFSAFQNDKAGLPQNEINRVIEFQLRKNALKIVDSIGFTDTFLRSSSLYELINKIINKNNINFRQSQNEQILSSYFNSTHPEFKSNITQDQLASDVVNNYVSNLRVVDQLAKIYNFETFYFWQPVLYSKDSPSLEEQSILNQDSSGREKFFQLVYSYVDKPKKETVRIINIKDIFKDSRETLYIDLYHVGESGNEIVANKIVGEVEKNSKKLGYRENKSVSP